ASIHATTPGISVSTQVTFRDDIPSLVTSSLTLSTASIPADGHSLVEGLLVVRDAAGRPLPGVPLVWDQPTIDNLRHVFSFDPKTGDNGSARVAYDCPRTPQAMNVYSVLGGAGP